MAILKLNKHNEAKEIEFELDYLTSLTTQQRFELMFRKTQEMLSLRKSRRHHVQRNNVIVDCPGTNLLPILTHP